MSAQVRLIAGQYGGRVIASPATKRTHPMGERIRGALFNIIGTNIEDAVVLDAFAGTGALGFEALSRGARHVTFIERDRVAQKVLAENAQKLHVNEKVKVITTSVANWMETNSQQRFDLIFCDPPYHNPQFSTVARLFGYLNPNGLMVLSHSGRSETPTANGVVVVDNRSYGDAVLTFYRRDI